MSHSEGQLNEPSEAEEYVRVLYDKLKDQIGEHQAFLSAIESLRRIVSESPSETTEYSILLHQLTSRSDGTSALTDLRAE